MGPPLVARRREALILSVGTVASGLLAYAFNVLVARALGPAEYGSVAALWVVTFLGAVLLFRPLEQTIAHAVAQRAEAGDSARAAIEAHLFFLFCIEKSSIF